METWSRLKGERERLGMNQDKFAAAAGVSRGAQINYEKGVRLPDSGYLAALAAMGADVLYIITGRRDESRLAPDEATLLDNYRQSPETGKRAIRGAASALAQPDASSKEVAA